MKTVKRGREELSLLLRLLKGRVNSQRIAWMAERVNNTNSENTVVLHVDDRLPSRLLYLDCVHQREKAV